MSTLVSILYPYQGNRVPKISLTENKDNNYQDGLLDIKLTLDGKVKSLKLDINQ
ncbi:Heparin-sulfate lyase precursor [compost metagenome]